MGEAEAVEIVGRTYQLGLRVLKFCRFAYTQKGVEKPLVTQVLRSGTSVGANVEEAQSAESRSDFRHKMSVAAKEARETVYWLRFFRDGEVLSPERIDALIEEATEVRNVLRAIIKKLRAEP